MRDDCPHCGQEIDAAVIDGDGCIWLIMQCSSPAGHAPHKIRTSDGRSQQGLGRNVIIGDIIRAAAKAPNPRIQRSHRGSGLRLRPRRRPRRISRFAVGAPRMRFSQSNSRSYATLRSGEARRGLVAAMLTAPPEPVDDRPSFERQRRAPMKVRRHTRSERLQTGGLSSRISFSSPNLAAMSPVVSKRSFDHEADPESDVHVTRTE
jgi:hypothetical protein